MDDKERLMKKYKITRGVKRSLNVSFTVNWEIETDFLLTGMLRWRAVERISTQTQ